MRLITLLFVSLCLVGCGPKAPSPRASWMAENGKVKILTSIAMIGNLAAFIGKEHVDVLPLISGDLDPHSYELVKGDDEKFKRADLVFYNGLGLEHGLSLKRALEKHPKAFALGDTLLKEDPSPILYSDGQVDPHIWMDIALWKKIVVPITEQMIKQDPAHAVDYQRQSEVLLEMMEKSDANAFETLQKVPEQARYLVSSHDAFRYFTRHYLANEEEVKTGEWEKRCAAPEGLAPDAQLSVSDIQEIISYVDKYHVPVLFPEANVSQDALRKIEKAATEKGLSLKLSKETLYGDSMGQGGYLDMVGHNVSVISKELGGHE